MGSYLYTGDVRFHLAKEQVSPAFDALATALREDSPLFEHDQPNHAKAYLADFYEPGHDPQSALKSIVELLGWTLWYDPQGQVRDITPVRDISCYEEALFSILGPFVTQGSFIECEEHTHGNRYTYRYAFTGKRMIVQEMTYPSIPDEE